MDACMRVRCSHSMVAGGLRLCVCSCVHVHVHVCMCACKCGATVQPAWQSRPVGHPPWRTLPCGFPATATTCRLALLVWQEEDEEEGGESVVGDGVEELAGEGEQEEGKLERDGGKGG